MNPEKGIKNRVSGPPFPLFVFCIMAAAVLVAGCGGGSGQGGTHALTAAVPVARVTGMVLLQTANAPLARAKGEVVDETGEGRSPERAAAQISPCGAVPAGYVAIPNATITVLNETGSTVTDDNGCFQMNIYTMGVKVFTARKTNSLGGATILKKAADVQPNMHIKFIDGESGPITILSTVAALIVAEKDKNGEAIPDPADLEDYIESIEDQQSIQDLEDAILESAAPGEAGLDAMDASLIAEVEEITGKPAIWGASVAGREVPVAGGIVTISAKAATFGGGNSVSAVSATLSPSDGGTPIIVALSFDNTNGIYRGAYTFAANGSASVKPYIVTISATDANSVVNTYASSILNIMQGAGVCGNYTREASEGCDDGNTVTETCVYGQTSCTVCNATCQSVAGALAGYCGDSTTQGGNGETCDDGANNGQPNFCNAICNGTTGSVCGNSAIESGEICDDGNTTTESCAYGQTSCTVCNATCQSVAGAVVGYCGDNTTQGGNGETCDDGNTTTETCVYGETSCTVCNATCQSAAGAVVGYCGDSTVDAGDGETCDDGNAVTETCTYGQTSCTVCNATCQSAAGAVVGYCGDSTIQAGNGETCDDGGESATCDANCTAAACGDGTINATAGETCDDSGESATCDTNCTAAACGDGTINTTAGETCDDGGESVACDSNCTAAACGDSTINATAGEACDDGVNPGTENNCSTTCENVCKKFYKSFIADYTGWTVVSGTFALPGTGVRANSAPAVNKLTIANADFNVTDLKMTLFGNLGALNCQGLTLAIYNGGTRALDGGLEYCGGSGQVSVYDDVNLTSAAWAANTSQHTLEILFRDGLLSASVDTVQKVAPYNPASIGVRLTQDTISLEGWTTGLPGQIWTSIELKVDEGCTY